MATIEEPRAVNEEKLMQFVFRAVDEVGATLNAALVVMGDKLGLYRALAGAAAADVRRAGRAHRTAERYVREWLNAQAAGGYVAYDPDERPLHAAARAGRRADRRREPGVPARLLPDRARARCIDSPRITEAAAAATASAGTSTCTTSTRAASASSGPATTPTDRCSGCRRSTASSRSSSAARRVADVGCGHGASTILMAKAFPRLDLRRLRLPRGLDRDRARPRRGGGRRGPRALRGRACGGLPRRGYDLVTMFDCLHDMGDPVGAARHVRERSRRTARG